MFKAVSIGFAVLVGVILLGWVLTGAGIIQDSIFGVWNQNVQTKIFNDTKQYNQSKMQDLAADYHEYNQDINAKDQAGADAVRSVVRQQFADYPTNRVNDPQLYSFLEMCRQ